MTTPLFFCSLQNLMREKNLEEYPAHKLVHDEFVAKISGLSAPISKENVDYVKQWLAKVA